MKNTVFNTACASIVTSILSAFLLAADDVLAIIPAWLLWGLFVISTTFAVVTVISLIFSGVAEWLIQSLNKRTA